MVQLINDWLSNPKRSFRDGFDIFDKLATDQQKKNFLNYLLSGMGTENVGQFDSRFSILINQIVLIQNRVKINPEAFAEAKAKLKADNRNVSETISQPKKEIKHNNIPKSPGAENIISKLPPEFEYHQERLKYLIPLMAKTHAEMADEKIADDKRATLRRELVEMDKERRSIWTEIDKYIEDGIAPDTVPSEEENQVIDNMIQLGAKTATRIGQLKGYISRSNEAIAKHKKNGKDNLAATAQEKVIKYTTELEELQKLLND